MKGFQEATQAAASSLAAEAKALWRAARAGDWEAARIAVAKSGPAAWSKRGLMGESPEEAAFARAVEFGIAPPWSWIQSMPASQARAKRLEEFLSQALSEGRSVDGGAAAGRWLGHAARPSQVAFDDIAQMPGLDPSGWAMAMGARARDGTFGREWASGAAFWELAGRAGSASDELFAGLRHAEAMAPFKAAALGAPALALRWVETLGPAQSLALMAAASCHAEEDWDDFEALCPKAGIAAAKEAGLSEAAEKGWRALAVSAAGLGPGATFDSLGVGEARGEVGRRKMENLSPGRWNEVLEACARKAAFALEDASLAPLMHWIAKRVPANAAAKAAPSMAGHVDFDSASEDDVVEALERLSSLRSGSTAAAGKGAAARLWELGQGAPQMASRGRRREGLERAAAVLWTGRDARGLEAFLVELSALAGSPADAARACGFKSWVADRAPTTSGNVLAVARAIPPGSRDAMGRLAWGEPDEAGRLLGSLRASAMLAARCDMIEFKGSADQPAPEPLPPMDRWGELDLGRARWREPDGAKSAVEGWEGAFEAIGALGLALGVGADFARPPEPLADPKPIPARNAWAAFVDARPDEAARWMCESWMNGGKESAAAQAACEWIGEGGWAKVAACVPEALEILCERWERPAKDAPRMDRVCALAARSLAPDEEGAHSARDLLCAAALCAAGYGMAESARMGFDTRHRAGDSFAVSAVAVAELLPQAAQAVQGRVDSGDDLAGKAAWAALLFKAHGWGQEGFESSMDDWSGTRLAASSPWARSCLAGLFTARSLEARGASEQARLLGSALSWAAESGCGGHERLEGRHSALEMAVDCHSRTDWERSRGFRRYSRGDSPGCFGEEAVRALVSAGADPSEPGAPGGLDALALCARLERRARGSSVMKELLRSKAARPGAGALWAILEHGKPTLSDKLKGELLAAAKREPTLEGLGRLGGHAGGAKALEAAFAASPAARALAPSLGGWMAAMGQEAAHVAAAVEAARSAGFEPDEASREAMFERMRDCIAVPRTDPRSVGASLSAWMAAGAEAVLVDAASLGESCASAWKAMGMEGPASMGELACALALARLDDTGHSAWMGAGRWAAWASEAAGTGFAGGRLGEAMSLVLARVESEKAVAQVRAEIGEARYAKLEEVALGASPLSIDQKINRSSKGPRI